MVLCHIPYPLDFVRNRPLIVDAINSAPARYKRLCQNHPGIVKDISATNAETGYPFCFPSKIFRCEYITVLLYQHFDIIFLEHTAMRNIIALRHHVTFLTKIFAVSIFIFITPHESLPIFHDFSPNKLINYVLYFLLFLK